MTATITVTTVRRHWFLWEREDITTITRPNATVSQVEQTIRQIWALLAGVRGNVDVSVDWS